MGSSSRNLPPLVIQSIIQHLVSRMVQLYVRTSGLKGRAYKLQPNPITGFKTYYSQELKRALNAEYVCVKLYNTKSATKSIRLQNTEHDKRSFSGQQGLTLLKYSVSWISVYYSDGFNTCGQTMQYLYTSNSVNRGKY